MKPRRLQASHPPSSNEDLTLKLHKCYVFYCLSELSLAASKTRSWTHTLKITVGRGSERHNEVKEVVVGSWTFKITFPVDQPSTMIPGFMGPVKHVLAEADGRVETRWQVP